MPSHGLPVVPGAAASTILLPWKGKEMDPQRRDTMPDPAKTRYARLYADLILAADNLDPALVHKWITEWGDLDAPVLGGRTVLERVLEEKLMPEVERLDLVRSLLRAGATPLEGKHQAVVQQALAQMAEDRRVTPNRPE